MNKMSSSAFKVHAKNVTFTKLANKFAVFIARSILLLPIWWTGEWLAWVWSDRCESILPVAKFLYASCYWLRAYHYVWIAVIGQEWIQVNCRWQRVNKQNNIVHFVGGRRTLVAGSQPFFGDTVAILAELLSCHNFWRQCDSHSWTALDYLPMLRLKKNTTLGNSDKVVFKKKVKFWFSTLLSIYGLHVHCIPVL